MRHFRFYIGVILSLILIGGFVSIARIGNLKKITPVIDVLPEEFIQRIEGVKLYRFKNDLTEWEIEAQDALVHKGKDYATLHDIKAVYTSPDRSPFKIIADRGTYDMDTDIFYAEKIEDDVNIRIGDKLTIITNSVSWYGSESRIHGEGKARLKGKRFILEGKGLSGSLSEGTYEIGKDIKALFW